MISQLNTRVFDDENLELDSYWLGPNMSYLGQAFAPGTFRGQVIRDASGPSATFALEVQDPSEQQSVTIDVSTLGSVEQKFTVAKDGYILFVSYGSSVGQSVAVPTSTGDIYTNLSPRPGDRFALRIVRPGTHTLTDAGGATCEVKVAYPGGGPLKRDAVVLQMSASGSKTTFDSSSLEISPLQPVVVVVLAGAHLQTKMVSVTDRVGGRLHSRPAAERK